MILSYEQIKALLTSWALNDARIPNGGILFGQSRKLLDAQRSEIQYPYFWVEEIAARVERNADGTQIDQIWSIDISVKKNSAPDDYITQEAAKSLCLNICIDFIKFLSNLHLQGEILFDQRNVNLREAEFYEGDVDFGYEMSLAFGEPIENICDASPHGRQGVKALNLQYEEAGILALGINGTVYQSDWDSSTHTHAQILHLFAQIINADDTQSASAYTDGVYLFVQDGVGDDPILDLEITANVHTWGTIITHDSSEGIEIQPGIVYNFTGGAGVSDHGLLDGLSDDDHPQYFNETRGDARYATLSHNHDWNSITDKPPFFSGAYEDLTGKPNLSVYLQSINAGSNISIDDTDPQHPVISASGGGATPAGSTGDIQYNNAGALGATTGFSLSSNDLTIPSSGAFQVGGTDILKDNGNGSVVAGDTTGSSGSNSICIGTDAGKDASETILAIGQNAGGGLGSGASGEGNFCIGDQAGANLSSGVFNFFFGPECGENETSGGYNYGFGNRALRDMNGGFGNVGFGGWALASITSHYYNTGIGLGAGQYFTGSNNTIIGYYAARNSSGSEGEGDGNVIIGYEAARYEGDLDNVLWIANNSTSTPLVYGEFDNDLLKIDGEIETTDHLTLAEITTPTASAGKGKIYTKSDNKLYFQDGAGTEHEIQFV